MAIAGFALAIGFFMSNKSYACERCLALTDTLIVLSKQYQKQLVNGSAEMGNAIKALNECSAVIRDLVAQRDRLNQENNELSDECTRLAETLTGRTLRHNARQDLN